jgi:hypothetical protein
LSFILTNQVKLTQPSAIGVIIVSSSVLAVFAGVSASSSL